MKHIKVDFSKWVEETGAGVNKIGSISGCVVRDRKDELYLDEEHDLIYAPVMRVSTFKKIYGNVEVDE